MTNETHFMLGGDLRIRRMGFGAMRLPAGSIDGPPRDPGTAVKVLRRAVELGVDHIDTAAFYERGGVAANRLIREALGDPYPEGLVIATKVGPTKGPDDPFPTGQAGPDGLRAQVEQNLSGLGLDRLDLVNLRPGGLEGPGGESIGERFEVLAGLREEGLIRHLGVSHVDAAQLAEARAIAPVACVQNRFDVTMPRDAARSVGSRDAARSVGSGDAALLAECEAAGIACVPYFPLGGFGIPDDARVARIAGRHGATPAQVLLAGLLALSPVMLAIPGTGSIGHLEENMAAADLRLTPDDIAELSGGATE